MSKTIEDFIRDPDFLMSSPETKRAVLMKFSPAFAVSSPEDQARAIQMLQPARGPLAQGMEAIGQQYQEKVAAPLTSGLQTALRAAFAPPHEIGAAVAGQKEITTTPEREQRLKSVSQFVVPQTPAQALMGGAAYLKGATALGRIGAMTAAGGIGGGVGPEGMLGGATAGTVGAVGGEVLGKAVELVRRGITHLTNGLYNRDAASLAKGVGDLVPSLKAKNADELADLVLSGKGKKILLDDLEAAYNAIESKVAGKLSLPSLSSNPMTFTEARKALRDLWKTGFASPLHPTPGQMPGVSAMHAKERFAQAMDEMKAALAPPAQVPGLARDFEKARTEFRVGINTLDMLHRANSGGSLFRLGDEVKFDPSTLQKFMSVKEGPLRRRMTDQAFDEVAKIVFRGVGPRHADTSGINLGRLLLRKPGTIGATEAFPRLSIPSYVGSPKPYAASPQAQSLTDALLGYGGLKAQEP